ncbi:MAG TPA: NAD-dependent epimerase/dehydratase family protein [Kribbellaceae bacterium]|jgi:nucleoside-diphosphate-sugar epimerase
MKVLVIGATGYIGSAVVERLRTAGHEPVAVSRDPRPDAPVETRQGDLGDPAALVSLVTDDIDAVVHAATPSGDWAADQAAIEKLVAPLRGTGRAVVYTSGVWVLGPADGAGEDAPLAAIPIVAGRPGLERVVLDAAEDGVRGIVIRPGIVHGHGGGIPGMLVGWAREHGAGRYVGSLDTRWPMVHADDLADLYVAALERAEAGAVLHGVAEPAVTVRDLAGAADVAAGGSGRAAEWPYDEAVATLGEQFADALALDQRVIAPHAEALGWTPTRAGALDDLRTGSYVVREDT